jgi:hypothetical protein
MNGVWTGRVFEGGQGGRVFEGGQGGSHPRTLQGGWVTEQDALSLARAHSRATLADELGIDFGSVGGRGRRQMSIAADLANTPPISRAEAISRLREMGFGPLDASQGLAATGSTNVNLVADWLLRSRTPSDPAYEASHSWTAGDREVLNRGFGGLYPLTHSSGGAPAFAPVTPTEARRIGRAIRRAGSLPLSTMSPAGGGGGRGWGGGWAVGGGGDLSAAGLGVGSGLARGGRGVGEVPRALSRRSASLRLPGALDEGNECCVCMDAPVQTRLVPCAHDCLCKACAQVIVGESRTCPLCRSATTGFILVSSRQ